MSYLAGVPCNIVPLSPTIHTSSAELPHTALKYVDDVAGLVEGAHNPFTFTSLKFKRLTCTISLYK